MDSSAFHPPARHDRPGSSHRLRLCSAWLLAVLAILAMQGARAAVPFEDLISLAGERLDRPVTVGDGEWTLVMLWASDCHICKEQKPVISGFHDNHLGIDARVFGIAMDGRAGLADVDAYLADHPASFPNYVGEFPIVAIHYQQLTGEALRGTPTYLLFDRDGVLQGNNPGPITVAALESFIARHDAAAAGSDSDP